MNTSVNTSVADYLAVAANHAHGNYGNLTLLMFNATLGVLAIDPSITNISILSPAIGDLFSEDIFSVPQACTYPISGMRHDSRSQFFYVTADMFITGQYGFLNRLLYYFLLLFAVLAASSSWLCWVRCLRLSCLAWPKTILKSDSLTS